MKTHLDLFSGIGGFALACRWNNIQTVGFVEYEDYPRRVLSKQFPGIPLFGDIRDFDATPFRGVDLITGGYPCQPFSQAGKRKGKEDGRHLWPEMFRVITQARPSWVLAENVAGHINLGLDEVLLDLESEGYTCRTVMVPACAKNALHIRQRCWIIARSLGNSNGERFKEQQVCVQQGRQDQTRSEVTRSGPDVAHSDSNERQSLCGQIPECSQTPQQRSGNGGSTQDVAHPDSKRRRMRHTVRQDAEDAGQSPRSTQHGGGYFKSHLGGGFDGLSEGLDFPRRWGDGTWEEGVPRVTTEKKNRTARLKALGNAIVPQIAYELIRCMKEIDEPL